MVLQSGASIVARSVTLPASTGGHPRHLAITLVNVLCTFGLTGTAGQPLLTESCELLILIAPGVWPMGLAIVTRKRPSGHGCGLGFLAASETAKTRTPRPASDMIVRPRTTIVRWWSAPVGASSTGPD